MRGEEQAHDHRADRRHLHRPHDSRQCGQLQGRHRTSLDRRQTPRGGCDAVGPAIAEMLRAEKGARLTSDLLTQSGFERLLRILDDDRERAAVAYEELRHRVAGRCNGGVRRTAMTRRRDVRSRGAKARRGRRDSAKQMPPTCGASRALIFYESARRRQPAGAPRANRCRCVESSPDVEAVTRLDRCLATLPDAGASCCCNTARAGRGRPPRIAQAGISPTALRIRATAFAGASKR